MHCKAPKLLIRPEVQYLVLGFFSILISGLLVPRLLHLFKTAAATTNQENLNISVEPPVPTASPTAKPIGDADIPKLESIKEAFLHVWSFYKAKAWGHDFASSDDPYYSDSISMSLSLLEAIGPLQLMNQTDEVDAIEAYLNSSAFSPKGSCNRADLISRALGGLISAFELTGKTSFMNKAISILSMFPPPMQEIFVPATLEAVKGTHFVYSGGPNVRLHDYGSVQLEFLSLFHYTKDRSYVDMSLVAYDAIMSQAALPGIIMTEINNAGVEVPSDYSVGEDGKSFYSTMTKMQLLTRDSFPMFMEKLSLAYEDIKSNLIVDRNESLFVLSKKPNGLEDSVDIELGFIPAMMLYYTQLNQSVPDSIKSMGDKILNGFIEILKANEIGVPPSTVKVLRKFSISSNLFTYSYPILESLLAYYRMKKDKKYRDIAWSLFLAVNSTCRTKDGFAEAAVAKDGKTVSLRDGDIDSSLYGGFFELMYLIFDDSNRINLDDWVINNAGHPLRRWPEKSKDLESNIFFERKAMGFGA